MISNHSGLNRSGSYSAISVSAARQYKQGCNRIVDLGFVEEVPIPDDMDTSSIQAFSKNGSSKRWTITCGRIVAVTLAGLYFVGRGRVVAVTCRDPILVQIVLLESSPAIEGIKLPFPERGLELLSFLRWPRAHLGGSVPTTIRLHEIRS